MTQVARRSFAERIHWEDRLRPALIALLLIALGIAAGAYLLAPRQQRARDTYLPSAFLQLPIGVVQVVSGEAPGALLPVRVADTSSARAIGFAGVGERAAANQFLLYALTRETASRASYGLTGVRVPLEFAVVNGAGEVVAIHRADVGSARVAVAEPHRWLLAAKSGTLEAYGIGVGARLEPDSVRKLTL